MPRHRPGLLESVERGGSQSQRRSVSELGIALGLVNAYLKRCVRKGFVKVGNALDIATRTTSRRKVFAEKQG